LLELLDRNDAGGNETEDEGDAIRNPAITTSPTPKISCPDTQQIRNPPLLEAERIESRAKLGRRQGDRFHEL
jgi:hypothetical protein